MKLPEDFIPNVKELESSKPVIKKQVLYRISIVNYGTQGTRDEVVPVTGWESVDKKDISKQYNEFTAKYPNLSFADLIVETKVTNADN